jgi:hypothetical protein
MAAGRPKKSLEEKKLLGTDKIHKDNPREENIKQKEFLDSILNHIKKVENKLKTLSIDNLDDYDSYISLLIKLQKHFLTFDKSVLEKKDNEENESVVAKLIKEKKA